MKVRYADSLPVLVALLLLAGCATSQVEEETPRPVVTAEMLEQIRSTKVVIGVDLSSQSQSTQAAVINTGQSLGMLGVMVDIAVNSAIENNRQMHERLMVEIQNAAIHFNFGGRFKSEFEPAVRRLAWLRVSSVAREPSPQSHKVKALVSQGMDDALLVTDVGYVIAPDLSRFTLSAHSVFSLRETQPQANSTHGKLFQRKHMFHYPLEQPAADKQQAAQAWAENNGAMVQRALQAGITNIVRSITTDLEMFRNLTGPAQSAQRTP